MAKNEKTVAKDPLEMLLKGEKISIKKKTARRGTFEIKFPLPSDLRKIDLRLADMLEGRPTTSFTPQTLADMRVYATLDVVVIDGPSWWKDLASSEACADNALISELYRSYLRLYQRTQAVIAQGRSDSIDTGSESGNEDATVVTGAFSSIANG